MKGVLLTKTRIEELACNAKVMGEELLVFIPEDEVDVKNVRNVTGMRLDEIRKLAEETDSNVRFTAEQILRFPELNGKLGYCSPTVIERLLGGRMKRSKSPVFKEWLELIEESEINWGELEPLDKDTFQSNEIDFSALPRVSKRKSRSRKGTSKKKRSTTSRNSGKSRRQTSGNLLFGGESVEF